MTNMVALKRRMGPRKAPKKTLCAPIKQLKETNRNMIVYANSTVHEIRFLIGSVVLLMLLIVLLIVVGENGYGQLPVE